jgi:DeoR/GlpR family transcriptional regulator of sugar metabolism
MLSLVTFAVFIRIFGRVGYVSPKLLMSELGMSRATAHRYLQSMIESGLVRKRCHGKYILNYDPEILDGYARIMTPLDWYIRQKKLELTAQNTA